MPGIAVVVSTVGGPLVLSLAGELSLAGDFSLAGELSLAGGLSLGISGVASGCSWWGCSAPTQTNSQMSSKKEYPCAPNSGKRTIYLRWGLLWRTVAGSGKVVSDAPPAVAVGSSSMIITGTLALFAALWARVLKRNKFRVKQMRYKTKQQELKNYKYNKRILLFFFLVRAERREVEVWLTSGARRRRSGFPWPLGGKSGGGMRRPRSGCRRGGRSGRSRSGGPGGPPPVAAAV